LNIESDYIECKASSGEFNNYKMAKINIATASSGSDIDARTYLLTTK
jgi:hypothetical protein